MLLTLPGQTIFDRLVLPFPVVLPQLMAVAVPLTAQLEIVQLCTPFERVTGFVMFTSNSKLLLWCQTIFTATWVWHATHASVESGNVLFFIAIAMNALWAASKPLYVALE